MQKVFVIFYIPCDLIALNEWEWIKLRDLCGGGESIFDKIIDHNMKFINEHKKFH